MNRWEDIAIFGKMISVGLLIGGYVFFGVIIGRKLSGLGYPPWMVALAPVAAAFFGLFQGWSMVKGIIKRKGKG